MAWLQWPAAWQTASVSNHGNEADPHLRENSVPTELNNSAGHGSHDSSSHTGEDACLLPYSDGQSTGDKHRRLEQRRSGTMNCVLEEAAPTKSPLRRWRQIAIHHGQSVCGYFSPPGIYWQPRVHLEVSRG